MRSALLVAMVLVGSGAALAAKPATLEGRWSSLRCGERSYERRITFEADGTFSSEDRISPCPEGVACVWSGIVTRRGTYKRRGKVVELRAEAKEQRQGQPLPATLTFHRGALSEPSAGGPCPYLRPEADPLK